MNPQFNGFSNFYDACDGIFLNYTWKDENLDNSKEMALSRGRCHDVYVGVDVFGRGCRGGGGFNSKEVLRLSYLFFSLVGLNVRTAVAPKVRQHGLKTCMLP